MRAKELVPILAEIYGVPFETAFMIDRSLAECGLREKGRGRSLPEMTRREAVIFLVACMVTQKATKAGQEVLPWLKADGMIADERSFDEFAQEHGCKVSRELGLSPETDPPAAKSFIRNYDMRKVVEAVKRYQVEPEPHGFINLIDCLMAACEVLEKQHRLGDSLKLEISTSHGWASLTVDDGLRGKRSELRFQNSEASHDAARYDHQINRTAVIYGDALTALAVRTEKPEAVN